MHFYGIGEPSDMVQCHSWKAIRLAPQGGHFDIGRSLDGSLRVGNLTRSLHITVGAARKLVDPVDAAKLLGRELDDAHCDFSRGRLAGGERFAEVSALLFPLVAELERAGVIDCRMQGSRLPSFLI
jgi:hypothetical protein